MAESKNLFIRTADGCDLPATHFSLSREEAGNAGPTVIISSAVAVPRKIYRHFANSLIENGAAHVYTYDFRGLGETNLTTEQIKNVRMLDWARHDFPSVVRFVEEHHPGAKILGVGHSFGAQLLGLSSEHRKIERYLSIAAGTGYVKHTRSPAMLHLHMLALQLASWVYSPQIPQFLSVGARIPVGVFKEWKQWSMSPKYMLSDPQIADLSEFSSVELPLRMLGFHDDPYATRDAMNHLAELYCNAEKELEWYSRKELSRPVGHMGFFKQENKNLWQEQAKWLLSG